MLINGKVVIKQFSFWPVDGESIITFKSIFSLYRFLITNNSGIKLLRHDRMDKDNAVICVLNESKKNAQESHALKWQVYLINNENWEAIYGGHDSEEEALAHYENILLIYKNYNEKK